MVAGAMTLMILYLREPKASAGTPSFEIRGDFVVVHPSKASYLILASVAAGRLTVPLPHDGTVRAMVADGSAMRLAELPHRDVYGVFSAAPLSVATIIGRLSRGLTVFPGATTVVFRW